MQRKGWKQAHTWAYIRYTMDTQYILFTKNYIKNYSIKLNLKAQSLLFGRDNFYK